MIFLCILLFLGRILMNKCSETEKNESFPDWKTFESLPDWYEKYKYKPEWDSLDRRPLPEWYDKAKIGILVHWGLYSVPSFQTECFWNHWEKDSDIGDFMMKNFPSNFTYLDFGPMFQAELFNPKSWAKLFSEAGARYVLLTSKHHDGFTLFPSKRTFGWKWNSVDVGPKRNLVRDVADAVRARDLKFGLYHSLFEWFEPRYLDDKANGFKTRAFTNLKLLPDLRQIVHDYKPSIIWSDGDWEANDTYWRSKEFLSWLYSDSPVKDEVVVNDRWGSGYHCSHGDFYTCAQPQYGARKYHKWENAFSLDKKSWGYRREMKLDDVMTFPELLKEVVSTVSGGGNALINVGATKEGTFPLIFQERLLSLGEWLNRNGEAIYETSPWIYRNETVHSNSNIWYTCVKDYYNARAPNAKPKENSVISIYIIILEKLQSNCVKLRNVADMLESGQYKIQLLGESTYLKFIIFNKLAHVILPVNYPEFPVLILINRPLS